jgi:hypothetical protein
MTRTTTGGSTEQKRQQSGPSPELPSCIDICTECHQMCLETVQTCLRLGGPHAEAGHIRLLLDCAQICQTSADFMSRGSPLHTTTCGACAEICRACADSCRGMDGEEMRRCAELCDRCADSCERMSGSRAH